MLHNIIGRLRLTGWLEGASYLLLLFIAMPLKHFAGKPEMVRIAGMAHGVLFILYCLAIAHAWRSGKISFKSAVLGFIASLLPFGPFVFDHRLAKTNETGS